jgi:hypothetical protein
MLSNSPPEKIPLPFANSGTRNTIPTDSQIAITPGAASLVDGFPPLTFTPLAAGGIPPYGADFNGIFHQITAIQQWQCAGGSFAYDASFSAKIGGYPRGAVLLRADGTGFWLNQTDSNTANPNTGGSDWVAFAPDWTGGIDTGSANACLVAYSPAVTALTDGMVLWFKAAAANTGPATLNVNGLGAKPLVGGAHAALQGGEVIANGKCMVVYNATLASFVLIECTGAAVQVAPAGASGQALQMGQKGIARFISSGMFTVPAGVTTLYVSACAAGAGAAGGGGSTNQLGVGGGGAGGGAGQSIIRQPFAVTPFQVIPVTIPSGGTGGTFGSPAQNGGQGGAGGNTVIGSLITLLGASASGGGASYTGVGTPGGGLSGTGYPDGNSGNDGANGLAAGVGNGGMGASSPFGGGGGGHRAGSTGGGGSPAYGFGGGGGGGGGGYGSGGGGANGGAGGDGAGGLAIIEW